MREVVDGAVHVFISINVSVGVQIANSNPLVSDRQDLTVLQREYAEDDTVYQLKIKVSQSASPAPTVHHLLLGLKKTTKISYTQVLCCMLL